MCRRLRAGWLHLLRHRPVPLMVRLSSYTVSVDTQPIPYTDTNETLCATEPCLIPSRAVNTDAPLCDWTRLQHHGNIFFPLRCPQVSHHMLFLPFVYCIILGRSSARFFNFTAHSAAHFGNILSQDPIRCRTRFDSEADALQYYGDKRHFADFAVMKSESILCKRPP